MSLKLFETSLTNVPAELHPHYTKQPNGNYALNVSDLDNYVAPLKSTIARSRLEVALKNANAIPQYVDLLLRRLNDRLAIGMKDGESTVQILPATSGTLTASDGGPDGATTLDELVAVTATQFPFLFASSDVALQGADPKVLTRAAFEMLSPKERAAKMSDGYRLTDDAVEAKAPPRPAGKVLSRMEFDALQPKERAARMAEGYKLVD